MLATIEMIRLVVERRPIFLDDAGLWIEPCRDSIRRDPIRVADPFEVAAETYNDAHLDRGLLLRWGAGSDRYHWTMRRTEPKKDAVRLAKVLAIHGLRVEPGMAHFLRRFLLDARPSTRIVGVSTTPAPKRLEAAA